MLLEWHLWKYVILATVLWLPVALVVAHLSARRRARLGRAQPVRTAYADVFLVSGTVPWLWMILTPGTTPGVSLVPLRDLLELTEGPFSTLFAQVGGNLLVFAALGALIGVRSSHFTRTWRVAVLAAALSVTVEALQYGLNLGRVSSIDDVLLNTAGAVLASMVTRPWKAQRPPVRTGPE